MILPLLAACELRAAEKFVVIEVEDKELRYARQSAAIGAAPFNLPARLGLLDRIAPDLNEPTARSNCIVIPCVREDTVTEERVMLYDGNLCLVNADDKRAAQLTADDGGTVLRW